MLCIVDKSLSVLMTLRMCFRKLCCLLGIFYCLDLNHLLVLHGPKRHCTCLTQSEKRKAYLLCCAAIETACPIHTSKRTKDIRTYGYGVAEHNQDQSMSLLQRLRKLLYYTDRKDQQHLNALQENKESLIAENFSAIELSLCSGRALKTANRNISEKIDDKVKIRDKTDDKVKVKDKIDVTYTGLLETCKPNDDNDKPGNKIDIMISKGTQENANDHDISSPGTKSSMIDATQPTRDRKGNRSQKQPDNTHGILVVRESSNSSHDRNMTIVAV